MGKFLPLQLIHCANLHKLEQENPEIILPNMMKYLPLLLRHCANLHNMVKLSLKQVITGSNRKNQDILLQNMVKLSLKQVIAGSNWKNPIRYCKTW